MLLAMLNAAAAAVLFSGSVEGKGKKFVSANMRRMGVM